MLLIISYSIYFISFHRFYLILLMRMESILDTEHNRLVLFKQCRGVLSWHLQADTSAEMTLFMPPSIVVLVYVPTAGATRDLDVTARYSLAHLSYHATDYVVFSGICRARSHLPQPTWRLSRHPKERSVGGRELLWN